MKIGNKVSISPQVTDRLDWVEGVIIEVEDNPYAGKVITAKSDDGVIFFERDDLFKLLKQTECMH